MLDGGRLLGFVSMSTHTLNFLKIVQELEMVYLFSVISFSFISNINSFLRGSLPPLIICFCIFVYNSDFFFIKNIQTSVVAEFSN